MIAKSAKFVGITQEELEQFLTRAYRALRPRRDSNGKEWYYDLNISKAVVIRVWSTISVRSQGQGAKRGADAIRVQLSSKITGYPLKTGKSPIVKRTPNWRDNLKARIGDEVEDYENREAYWESQAQGRTISNQDTVPQQEQERPEPVRSEPAPKPTAPPNLQIVEDRIPPNSVPATAPQLSYLTSLLGNMRRKFGDEGWEMACDLLPRTSAFRTLDTPPTKSELVNAGKFACSQLINVLLEDMGCGFRRASADGSEGAEGLTGDPLDLYGQTFG